MGVSILVNNVNEFNYEGFVMLAQATQENIYKYLGPQMKLFYGEDKVEIEDKYIYCKGDVPILLCCHMDTVHTSIPEKILYDKSNNMIWSPFGIGGDDRCGVYSVLSILKYCKKLPSVLFTKDEEIGCVGAKSFLKNNKKNPGFKYLIEIDRHGNDEVVFYSTTNRDFIKYVTSFGFKEMQGMSSDIRHITDDWGCASCNVSAGYFNEHTKQEYVDTTGVIATINKVIKMVEDIDNTSFWKSK